MISILIPIAAIIIALILCFIKVLKPAAPETNLGNTSPTRVIDVYMNNKNTGVDGNCYFVALDGCHFNYTGWAKGPVDGD